MPHRPFTRAQTRENVRFLRALARTGNARLAAQELGVHRSTYLKRRAKNPRFAALWDAALVFAHANLDSPPGLPGVAGGGQSQPNTLRITGKEPLLIRLPTGRTQLRRRPPRRLDVQAEHAFLAALEEGATVRAAAAAAGFTHPVFYARAKADPAFAREMEIARNIGTDRRMAASMRLGWRIEDWEGPNPDVPIPKMTAEQALFQLMVHRPDGPFQCSQKRRRPPPRFDQVRASIYAKVCAVKRWSHHRETGSWRLPGEGEAAVEPRSERAVIVSSETRRRTPGRRGRRG